MRVNLLSRKRIRAWHKHIEQGAYLALEYRVDQAPQGEVMLRMDCQYPCTGSLDFTDTLESVEVGQWQSLSVPLACFAKAGADLSVINAPLVIATSEAFTMTLKRVAITGEAESGALFNCQ
jgi:beta-glucosidase